MIVAIEGPSAAGKTTWCRNHYPIATLHETPYDLAAPDLFDDPAEVGRFWVTHNVRHWQRALALEREHGIAFCDGDPFHLYFSWALWKAAALPGNLFEIERELYREAFERSRSDLPITCSGWKRRTKSCAAVCKPMQTPAQAA